MRKAKLDILVISRVYPPEGGGVATHVYYLAYALSKLTRSRVDRARICKVHVLTPGGDAASGGVPPNLIVHGAPGSERHFSTSGGVPLGDAVRYCLEHWWQINADVIHAHDFESLQIGLMLKAAFGVPLVFTVHKVPTRWDSTLPQRDVKDCFLQAALQYKFVDRLVAPSTAYHRRLEAQGFPDEKITLVPHGVPVKWLSSWQNKKGIFQRLNLSDDHELILCPSRLDPDKGLETLVDAAAILKATLPGRNLIFAIAGAGSQKYRTQLENRAQDCSVKEIMRFGPSDHRDFSHQEMPSPYRRAKMCVLPSRREGFGQVLLEAFVFRKPVVAANTGGIPDVVIPEDSGLLFNRDDPADLAHQIQRVLEDNILSDFLAHRGYEKIRREFNAESMARAYFKLYQEVGDIKVQ